MSRWCDIAFVFGLSNAFNVVDRSVVRGAVRKLAPSSACWVHTCYSKPSWLILGSRTLQSSRGVQQGDPLGQALFSMAIDECIRTATSKVREEFRKGSLDLVNFYLDDGVVAGEAAAVPRWSN